MTNPIINEIASLSPAVQSALIQAHQQIAQGTPAAPSLPASPSTLALPSGANTTPRLIAAQQNQQPSSQAQLQRTLSPPPAAVPGLISSRQPKQQSVQAAQPPSAAPKTLAMPQPPMPTLTGGPSQSEVKGPLGTTAADQAEFTRKLTSGSGVSQIHNPILKGLATVGDVLGSTFAPRLTQAIPGTTLHHDMLLKQDEGRIGQDIGNEQKQALIQHTNAETANAQSPNLIPLSTDSGYAAFNPKSGKATGITDENNQPLAPVAKDGKTAEPHYMQTPDGKVLAIRPTSDGKYDTQLVYSGDPKAQKPDTPEQQYIDEYQQKHPGSGVSDALKQYAADTQKPIRISTASNDNHDFQEAERGRGLLDKAEGAYRTAQQGANGLRDMIAQADAGNQVSAQVLPLQGALEITTAQGVHRINRTEVDQYAGAGSLYDKVAGELGKVTQGQPIPSNIRADMRKLADIEEKAAYQTYKGAFDSATKRYNLKDEQALPEPAGGASQGGGIQVGQQVKLKNGQTITVKAVHPDGSFE